MGWLVDLVHEDRPLFDSLWYTAFPPAADPFPVPDDTATADLPGEEAAPPATGCDVDAILGRGRRIQVRGGAWATTST